MRHGSLGVAILITVMSFGGCGGRDIADPGPTMPTAVSVPTPIPCSPWPGPEANVLPDRAFPGPDQGSACSGNVLPRIEDAVASRRGQGVELSFYTVDADAHYSCSSQYFNGEWRGGRCGGVGRVEYFFGNLSNSLSFPLHVRVVAWDDRGCLAAPVCLSVQ